jgi:acetoin utilization deacetylase AcuC-like enzyme
MSASSQLIPSDKMINCNFLYNPVFDQNSSTGLVYELELCNHKCICNDENNHPENSLRVLAIWRRLHDSGLMAKCARIESRRASLTELQLCHGETYANYFGRSPYERIKLRHLDLTKLPIEGLTQLECGGQGADIDTAWNEEQTPGVARLAVGCVIEAAVRVASGKLLNAFAVVRPPGELLWTRYFSADHDSIHQPC